MKPGTQHDSIRDLHTALEKDGDEGSRPGLQDVHIEASTAVPVSERPSLQMCCEDNERIAAATLSPLLTVRVLPNTIYI
jgi:hypothetical protein